ncbi:MAG: DUF6766 family protein [Vicinamibacterales bacterium]
MWRNNGLSIVLFGLFTVTMAGQALTGWSERNGDARSHGNPEVGMAQYLASGHFWEATGENWESEFLQMAMFVYLTIYLRQKGSSESKRIDTIEAVDLDPLRFRDDPDVPAPVRAGGWVLKLYEHSLGLAFALLFLISIGMHLAGGLASHNRERREHGEPLFTWTEYGASAEFWFESFQNWQSEFLSLGMMVVGTVYLRHRGSAESKPVYAAHSETGR